MQFSLLDDASGYAGIARSRLYRHPCAILRCTAPDQVQSVLRQAETYLAQGWHAVYLGRYELAGSLHQVAMHANHEPLFEIQFYPSYEILDAQGVEQFLSELAISASSELDEVAGVYDFIASCDEAQFEEKITQLQAYLAQGHSYQINLTYRLFFKTYGSAIALYRRLRARQPVAYGALIKLEQGWVLSFSPELFIRRQGTRLLAKPMKGTAPRSGLADESESFALANDAKNKTENLIIVDLLRNDLGRVSLSGSVTVPQLFEVEAHPTVWQMTSTISAHCRPRLDLYTLLQALFPCGSVTGAPKRRSLEIITELETHPRRLYCGALGWIDPVPAQETTRLAKQNNSQVAAESLSMDAHKVDDAPPLMTQSEEAFGDFCFSVPIRTLLLDQNGNGELGIGAGITYDSCAKSEYEECQLKAKFLTDLPAPFSLIETMAMDQGEGYLRLPMHLQRLKNSADVFGFVYQEKEIFAQLQTARRAALESEDGAKMREVFTQNKRWRARLVLAESGELDIQLFVLKEITHPVRLFWARHTVKSQSILLRHKTTHRAFYDQAWQAAEHIGGFDAIFCNERGEVTEGARSNLFVQIEGEWLTPSVECGLLPGVMREQILAQGQAREAILKPKDLLRAQAIFVCNSMRGILPAVLLDQSV